MESSSVANTVELGEVFTRSWVCDLILDLCDYTSEIDLSSRTILEPSVGSGAFVAPIVHRLVQAKQKHQMDADWLVLEGSFRGWDLLHEHVESSRHVAFNALVSAGCPADSANALVEKWLQQGDFLLDVDAAESADYVVGNPPYIRIEAIEPKQLDAYRQTCTTMTGRSDIFVGFYEKALAALKQDGILGFICADRWMRNGYGRHLRKLIVDRYAVENVLVAHDADVFESKVSAYPAITILRNQKQNQATYGDATESFAASDAMEYLAFSRSKKTTLTAGGVTAAKLPGWHTTEKSWAVGSPALLKWLETIETELPFIEESGARIGIGVATGKDSVYVTGENTESIPVEAERLLPLAMRSDINKGTFRWGGRHLVNPWAGDDTGLVDLSDYPQLTSYYEGNREVLTARNVARRSGPNWHRTIDRVNHSLLKQPMLLMADMTSHAEPVLAPAGYYPHHNLYYVTSDTWDLEVLGGLLFSDVVEAQVAAYCVKMRGGTLRFQAQFLRRVRIPHPSSVDARTARQLAQAFKDRDRSSATKAALAAFGLARIPV